MGYSQQLGLSFCKAECGYRYHCLNVCVCDSMVASRCRQQLEVSDVTSINELFVSPVKQIAGLPVYNVITYY